MKALFLLFLVAATIAGFWKLFEKAGKPGWAALVPGYNMVVLLQIAQRPIWWVALMVIPFVNCVIFGLVALNLAKVFGKSKNFGLGLFFAPPVLAVMLGLDDSRYQGGTPRLAYR